MINFSDILDQKLLFIASYTPFDFSKYMGQLAVEIKYTNGETQMLTTRSTNPNVFDTPEFETTEDYYEFIEFLNKNNIKREHSA